MAAEAKTQTKIIEYLNVLPETWLVKTITTNKPGTPDIIVCHKGMFIGIEVKSETGKLSRLQKYRLKEIRDAGGETIIARSLSDVKKVIK